MDPDGLELRGVTLKAGDGGMSDGQGNACKLFRRAPQADLEVPFLCHFRQGFKNEDVSLAAESELREQRLVENENHGEVWMSPESRVVIPQ